MHGLTSAEVDQSLDQYNYKNRSLLLASSAGKGGNAPNCIFLLCVTSVVL